MSCCHAAFDANPVVLASATAWGDGCSSCWYPHRCAGTGDGCYRGAAAMVVPRDSSSRVGAQRRQARLGCPVCVRVCECVCVRSSHQVSITMQQRSHNSTANMLLPSGRRVSCEDATIAKLNTRLSPLENGVREGENPSALGLATPRGA
eukprot:1150455-Pelagomonas_calceolata.AAC.1